MIIGVTGSIGSGKSTVAELLARYGAVVFNADEVAHRCLEPNTESYSWAVKFFGSSILGQDGWIDRARLGKIVFSDLEKLQKLCQVIHPCVKQKFKEEAAKILKRDSKSHLVFDVPLLIESRMDREVDVVVVAATTIQKQIERTIERFGFTQQEVLRRIHAQLPLQAKAKRADFVISTSGTIEETTRQAEKLWQKLQVI